MKESVHNMFGGDPHANVDLMEIEAFIENGKPYLKLVYRIENANEIFTVTIPKAELPLSSHKVIVRERLCDDYDGSDEYATRIGMSDNTLILRPDATGAKLWKHVIEKKTREMTMEEIERELGYSVKIVRKK